MTIELDDMDVPYAVQKDVTDGGRDFIRIMSRYDLEYRDKEYDICLDVSSARELARVLEFMADEIEVYDNR